MENSDYRVELKFDESELDKWEPLLSEVESEYDVSFEEADGTAELGEPVSTTTIIAVLSGARLALALYNTLSDLGEDAEVSVTHEGEGDIYVINSEEAESIGANRKEVSDGNVLVELSIEELMELKKIRDESTEE